MIQARVIKLGLLTAAFSPAYAIIFVHVFRQRDVTTPPSYLLTNVDSLLFFSSFHAARQFGSIFDLQTFAFGQGFGAFQHPAIFHPFWWFLDWLPSVEIAYLISEFLFSLCIFAFAYFVSTSLLVSGVAAFFATAFFFVPELFADHFGPCAPQVVLQIGLTYLALAAIGFGLRLRVWMLAGFAMLLYVIIMDWMYVIFSLPFVGACLAGLGLSVASGAERKMRPRVGMAFDWHGRHTHACLCVRYSRSLRLLHFDGGPRLVFQRT
jgi:hypothetical protein